MPRILRASLARTDLLGIWAHIAAESSAPIADNVLARLYGALEVLASAPYIGRERPEFAGGPRSLAVRPYLIFYEPLADGDGIAIWRVLRGAWRTCCAGRLGSSNRREGSDQDWRARETYMRGPSFRVFPSLAKSRSQIKSTVTETLELGNRGASAFSANLLLHFRGARDKSNGLTLKLGMHPSL